MQFELEPGDDGIQRIAVIGEISPDAPGFSGLQDQYDQISFSKPILLNLEQAPFINSSGVGWLLSLHKKAKAEGGRLIVHSLAPAVRNVLKLMSMDRVLVFADDRAKAENLIIEQSS